MIDVYRTIAKPHPPACMHCMTSNWMTFDPFWGHWSCGVCGECDCCNLPSKGESFRSES